MITQRNSKSMPVVADDAEFGKVVLTPQVLKKAEMMLERVGLKEAALHPSIHHILAGAAAYMLANTVDPKSLPQAAAFFKQNKALFMRMTSPATEDPDFS